MRSRAVSLPSLCCRSMRASPPPNSLSRLRRSSSSISFLADIYSPQRGRRGRSLRPLRPLCGESLQHEVALRRDARHLIQELVLGRLARADRFREPPARFLLDRVVGLEIVLERAGDDLDADLRIAEFDEAAILEPIHNRPGEKFDLPDVRRHRQSLSVA